MIIDAAALSGELSRFSNFPQIAGFYSQLAAVLAGFAFAGLITLVAAQLVSGSVADMALRSYRPLVSAFVGLVVTSFNYAIIAGEDRDTPRLAGLGVTAGVGFCVAAALMLYSIIVLLRGVEHDLSKDGVRRSRTADLLRSTLIFGVCPLLVVMEYGAIGEHLLAKYPEVAFRGLDLLAIVLLLLTLGVAAVVPRWFPERSGPPERREARSGVARSDRMVDRLSHVGMVIAVLSLLTSSFTISFVGKNQQYSDYVSAVCLLGLAVFLWLMMYSVATYEPGAADEGNAGHIETAAASPEGS